MIRNDPPMIPIEQQHAVWLHITKRYIFDDIGTGKSFSAYLPVLRDDVPNLRQTCVEQYIDNEISEEREDCIDVD